MGEICTAEKQLGARAHLRDLRVVDRRVVDAELAGLAALRVAVAAEARAAGLVAAALGHVGALVHVVLGHAVVAVARVNLHGCDVPVRGALDELREACRVAVKRLAALATVALRNEPLISDDGVGLAGLVLLVDKRHHGLLAVRAGAVDVLPARHEG